MPDYNYQNGWLCYVDSVTDDAEFDDTDEIDEADIGYIGVMKAGSGNEVQPTYTERDNVGNEIHMKFKLTHDIDVLTLVGSDLRTAIDGKTMALLFVPAEFAEVDREGDTIAIVGADPTGTMFCPCELFVGNPVKAGQTEVTAVKITGDAERTSKALLIKTVDLVPTE